MTMMPGPQVHAPELTSRVGALASPVGALLFGLALELSACTTIEVAPLEDRETEVHDQFHQGGLVDVVPDDPGLAEDECTAECSAWAGPEVCGFGARCLPRTCRGSLSTTMACRGSTGHKAPGEACVVDLGHGGDDCRSGALCLPTAEGRDGIRPGRCVAYCEGDPAEPQCPGTQLCAITRASTLPLCLDRCDPLQQDCPGVGELCVPFGDPMVPVCVPGNGRSLAPVGQPCDCVNCCIAGAVCVDSRRLPGSNCSERPCCARLCERAVKDACGIDSGLSCRTLDYVRSPGTREAGICTRR